MLRRCAWCGQTMGRSEPLDDESETHGICPPCGVGVVEEPWRARAAAGSPPAVEEVALVREAFARLGADLLAVTL